jgi:hypothetical protein
MAELIVQLPASAFSALRKDPGEIAGLSRAEFISALNRLHVSPLQYSPEELSEELRDAD